MSDEPTISDEEIRQFLVDMERPREAVRLAAEREAQHAARFKAEYQPPPLWLNDAVVESFEGAGYALRFIPGMQTHPEMQPKVGEIFHTRCLRPGWYFVSNEMLEADDIAERLLAQRFRGRMIDADGTDAGDLIRPRRTADYIAALPGLDLTEPRLVTSEPLRMPTAQELFYLAKTGSPDLYGEVLCVNGESARTPVVTVEGDYTGVQWLRAIEPEDHFDGGIHLMRQVA